VCKAQILRLFPFHWPAYPRLLSRFTGRPIPRLLSRFTGRHHPSRFTGRHHPSRFTGRHHLSRFTGRQFSSPVSLAGSNTGPWPPVPINVSRSGFPWRTKVFFTVPHAVAQPRLFLPCVHTSFTPRI